MEQQLKVSLLGRLEIQVAGQPLDRLAAVKSRALLAYLAATGQSQPRTTLAGLLWSDVGEDAARTSLRSSLTKLRKSVGDYIIANRQSIAINQDLPVWVDLNEFEDACRRLRSTSEVLDGTLRSELRRAVHLYQGDFLSDFQLPDALIFEDWLFMQREHFRQMVLSALSRLVEDALRRGTLNEGIDDARRILALDGWQENAHRQLMALLARNGQRSAALAQFESCKQILGSELGVEPDPETAFLAEQIRSGELSPLAPAASTDLQDPEAPTSDSVLPAVLDQPISVPQPDEGVFVARERELGWLKGHLDQVADGAGRTLFVIGEAGAGKTALVSEFARQVQIRREDLVVAIGSCNAQTGSGDPYLPFREILALLTGDVEAKLRRGVITPENAARLRRIVTAASAVLLDQGPALIDTLVSGAGLTARAQATTQGVQGSGSQVQELPLSRPLDDAASNVNQGRIFEEYTRVLQALSEQFPLMLVLDDLHWVDTSSVNLLFHLGRRISSSRILSVGNYRPVDVMLNGNEERHPLTNLLSEFRRQFGDIWLDLDQVAEEEGWHFVNTLLDTQPNQLDEEFRHQLHSLVRGQPLYTVELLRDMQERGDLVQDRDGTWRMGPSLNWNALPTRVEGVIEKRVGRLDAELREALVLASVEGEEFTAQVIAELLSLDERRLIRTLSGELERRHQLVGSKGIKQLSQRRLSIYHFQHSLYRIYLYNSLGEAERTFFHEDVGNLLETLYGPDSEEISVQLAHHFYEAGISEKAIRYLSIAGDRARLAYAHQEAVSYYEKALELLKEAGLHEQAARMLMKLGLTYHQAFDFSRARQAYDEGCELWRWAGELRMVDRPAAPHPLRLARREPSGLDPALDVDVYAEVIIDQIFSGLLELSPELDAVPSIAHRWHVSEGGRTYVFYLRDDACWSDGHPVTAGDFEYAWKRILDPAIGSPSADLLYDIKGARSFNQGQSRDAHSVGINAEDELTLVVELEHPSSYFPHILTSSQTRPVPRHVVEEYGDNWTRPEHIVTNGPFRLQDWVAGEYISLVRNQQYHGRFTGNLEEIRVRFIQDPDAEVVLYEENELDMLRLVRLPAEQTSRVRQSYASDYVSIPRLFTNFALFDVTRAPFDDPRVRLAFVHALNRETMAGVAMRGYAFPATGGLVPPGMPGHRPDIGLAYDLTLARDLLAEAGFPDGRGFNGNPLWGWNFPFRVCNGAEHCRRRWNIDRLICSLAAGWPPIPIRMRSCAWACSGIIAAGMMKSTNDWSKRRVAFRIRFSDCRSMDGLTRFWFKPPAWCPWYTGASTKWLNPGYVNIRYRRPRTGSGRMW
jgi:DNA-binding SARP family transcriptional activator